MQPLVHLAGRSLLALAFVGSAAGTLIHFSDRARAIAEAEVPLPTLLLSALVGLELIGALAVLVGFRARAGAVLLSLCTIGHMGLSWGSAAGAAGAWSLPSGLAIMGGLLILFASGAGPYSLDEMRKPRMDYGDSNVLG